jgi:serine/threonine protein kinase
MTEREIFDAALAIADPAGRAAYLDDACRGDPGRRDHIAGLLEAHLKLGSFLEVPLSAVARKADRTIDQPPERPGTQIGPYKLRERLGEGGFGIVYVAEQEQPVRRKVALKIIKPGMDTAEVVARFEAERQALALMDHPHVAKVLDGGATTSGRPYFVMELVHGIPITSFCDKNSLPMRERLLLFADVCKAVQHAHQKGIIHRDLKPSNIMVTLHDGKPVAKVIDFGVSKALSQQLTEKTIYTAYGQMIGTPTYMSPEQAEMSGLGIDTRSDIYSLGVLLYELMTGKTPLDTQRLRTSAYEEILRLIREEEPPRPSHKISTMGDEATVVAHHRHTDVKQLRRVLRGELDWIVMKCLEKDRSRRYETAVGLARDIERYLNDEPVEACPPSTAYFLSKLARRYRWPLAWAASIAAVLVLGFAISTWQAIRATNATRRAELARSNEAKQLRVAVEQKNRADANAKRSEQLTELVRGVVRTTATHVRPDHGDSFTLMTASNSDEVDIVLGGLDTQIRIGSDSRDRDRARMDEAINQYLEFRNLNPNDATVSADLAWMYFTRGVIEDSPFSRKSREKSEAAFREAIDGINQLAGNSLSAEVRFTLSRCYARLARLRAIADQLSEADDFFVQAVKIQSELIDESESNLKYRKDRAATYYNWANTLRGMDRQAEAETRYHAAQKEFKECDEDRLAGYAARSLGNLRVEMGKLSEAKEAYEVALQYFQPANDAAGVAAKPTEEFGRTHLRLAEALDLMKRTQDAEREFRAALAIYQSLSATSADDARRYKPRIEEIEARLAGQPPPPDAPSPASEGRKP